MKRVANSASLPSETIRTYPHRGSPYRVQEAFNLLLEHRRILQLTLRGEIEEGLVRQAAPDEIGEPRREFVIIQQARSRLGWDAPCGKGSAAKSAPLARRTGSTRRTTPCAPARFEENEVSFDFLDTDGRRKALGRKASRTLRAACSVDTVRLGSAIRNTSRARGSLAA